MLHDSSSLVSSFLGILGLWQGPQFPSAHHAVSVNGVAWRTFNASIGGILHQSTGTEGPCARVASVLRNITLPKATSNTEKQWQKCLDLGANGGNHAFYVQARSAQDISETMRFVQETHVPLVIDHLQTEFCASPAPNSLAIWTRDMTDVDFLPSFVPSQCPSVSSTDAIAISAGATLGKVYAYADKLDLTVVGASIPSLVGSGSDFLADATSILAPTYGSALDNVLEFEVVTPDGSIRTVNPCLEKDLWFALRGGGASSFGLGEGLRIVRQRSTDRIHHSVTRTIVRAHPRTDIHTLSAVLKPSPAMSKRLLTVTSHFAVEWAEAGWGGFIGPSGVFLANPGKLGEAASVESLKPLTILLNLMREEASEKSFVKHSSLAEYMKFFATRTLVLPMEYAVSSRLIPKSVFESKHGKEDLSKAIVTAAQYVESWTISLSLPYGFKQDGTSLTPAMYESPWLVYFTETLTPAMGKAERLLKHSALAKAVNFLRYITPGSGTYYAQADVSEVDHEFAFWGANHERLLEVKHKYDPEGVLNGWQSVGWKGPTTDARFTCYTPAKLQRVRCDRYCR